MAMTDPLSLQSRWAGPEAEIPLPSLSRPETFCHPSCTILSSPFLVLSDDDDYEFFLYFPPTVDHKSWRTHSTLSLLCISENLDPRRGYNHNARTSIGASPIWPLFFLMQPPAAKKRGVRVSGTVVSKLAALLGQLYGILVNMNCVLGDAHFLQTKTLYHIPSRTPRSADRAFWDLH